MVDFTTGDSVRKLELTTTLTGNFGHSKSVTGKKNGVVTSKTYERTYHYITPRIAIRQNTEYKAYTLKKVGASYVITNIVVTKRIIGDSHESKIFQIIW